MIIDTRDFKQMEEWGREMVRNCSGLPLAIIVLGGILVTKPSFYEWEKVYYDSLSSLKRGEGLGEGHQGQVFDILTWSYNDLPSQLKICFLYMGKFAEDEEVEAETLYQLLIAEGMVLSSDRRGGETMMQVAESYMGELVHKSMVQVKYEDDINSQRKFKSCQLHDLMRDLSMSIAEGEDFFKVVKVKKDNDYQFDPALEVTPSSTRQLVFYFDVERHESIKDHPFLVNKYKGRARSVLVFASNSFTTKLVSHVLTFRLLRVFSLEGVGLTNNLGKILGRLVHLRYLSLMGTNLLMFSNIKNLELLQTLKLVVHGDLDSPPRVSSNILRKLGRLRHLYLPYSEFRIVGKNIKLRFDGLSKLETLENFDPNWCEVKDLPKLISLQKLSLIVHSQNDLEEILKYSYSGKYLDVFICIGDSRSENVADMWRQLFWNHKFNLQELQIIGKLPELVQIFGQQQQQLDNTPVIDVSLICITSLYLQDSCLLEDPMPVLEKIPTLRVLNLFRAYGGKEMVCSAMGFPKLTHLELWWLDNLEKWRVEEGSMPILQNLGIYECRKLEELPEGLRFLKSLQTLNLLRMPSDFCDRVRVINGEHGPDLYKVAHVPALDIDIVNWA